ncbi:MAG: hypothetical protein EBR59_10445, partial [Methylococcaceae bacterium]|nr:hypothetical protein [Methylococcaceae bacterium]
MWVAVGTGNNSIAHSEDGITWTGLGTTIAATGNAVAWNGYMWIAGFTNDASHNNTLAYSYDGLTWTGLGNGAFTTSCLTLDWNGQLWVAGGLGTHAIAYSSDGIIWHTDCTMEQALTSAGYGIAGNANQFVAVGAGTNTTVSTNSSGNTYTNLYGIGNNIITSSGRGIAYNSLQTINTKWIAGGTGAYPIAYSGDGYTWSGATFIAGTTFSICYGVASNNKDLGNEKFITVGATGSCAIASSIDGMQWSGITYYGSNFTFGYGVACNNANNITDITGTTGIKWVAVGKGNSPITYAELNTGSISFNQTTDIALNNVRGIAYNSNSSLNRW